MYINLYTKNKNDSNNKKNNKYTFIFFGKIGIAVLTFSFAKQ